MRNIESRIAKLEKAVGDRADIDRRQSILPLACAAFRRRYAEIEGEPMPVSRWDARLDDLKRNGVSHTNEPLLGIAIDMLREGGVQ